MLNLLTLAYCEHLALREGMEMCRDKSTLKHNHYYLWHHYPLDVENNKIEHEKIVKEFNLISIDPPNTNIGTHNAQNWCLERMNIDQDNDFLITFDHDSRPVTHGWDNALNEVMKDKSIGWAALFGPWSEIELKDRPHTIKEVNGFRCAICPGPMMINISAIRLNWVKAAGGFWQSNNYYGGLELCMFPHMKSKNMDLAILLDYKETDVKKYPSNDLYNQWKREHAHNGFKGNFDKYLEIIK